MGLKRGEEILPRLAGKNVPAKNIHAKNRADINFKCSKCNKDMSLRYYPLKPQQPASDLGWGPGVELPTSPLVHTLVKIRAD